MGDTLGIESVVEIGEPVESHIKNKSQELLVGEAVARESSMTLSRRGRSGVRVRIAGEGSMGWLEAAEAWGCRVEAMVVGEELRHRDQNKLMHLVSDFPSPTPLASALTLPPHISHGSWKGLMLATIQTDKDAALVNKCFQRWQPWVAIFAIPSTHSRRSMKHLMPSPMPRGYTRKVYHSRGHGQFGGVTTSTWHFVHLASHLVESSRVSLMTMEQYRRPLQTALDDVQSGSKFQGIRSFEMRDDLQGGAAGLVHLKGAPNERSGVSELVYCGTGTGPDISMLDRSKLNFWVRANSVFSSEPVIRQVKFHELFAMWDYEGKNESRNWSEQEKLMVLKARLRSPPAKMIRAFLSAAADAFILDAFPPSPLGTAPLSREVGKTDDVPFNTMESKVETRLAATQADDAEVDLSTWAIPEELPPSDGARDLGLDWFYLSNLSPAEQRAKITSSRTKLRSVAVKWWACNHRRKAYEWLEKQPRDQDKYNVPAIEDCLRRIDACTYFSWVRGSRIHIWEVGDEFLADFRDGVEFFHLSRAPSGMTHNLPAPSREAEIETRKKVFKLKFQWYIEKKYVNLVIGRFAVVKLIVDGVVVDIRVVWDSKSNGHNATLWSPKFRLDDCSDLEECVVKWLAVPVAEYLADGSPIQDYTQPNSKFVKSKMGDVDVGQMFHNFMAHPKERADLGVRWIETCGTADNGAYERHEIWRFNRSHFGGKFSPYSACQSQNRILQQCMGDRHDPNNRWQWDRVILNLPFSPGYDPSLPRVLRIRKDGELATVHVTFVDDIRPTGRDSEGNEQTKQACRQLKSRMNTRGNQADDRKYRPPSFTQGAWNGVMIHTDTPFPRKSTTQKKWTKLREGLQWIKSVCEESEVIETARLRRVAGLAVNVTEVYRDARSYLKGIFNAIESFRSDRDDDGWRVHQAMEQAALDYALEEDAISVEESPPCTNSQEGSGDYQPYPESTQITPQMRHHVEALNILFNTDTPHSIPIRPTDKHKFRIVIGDASAEGFGVGTQYPDLEFEGRDGLWTKEFGGKPSNLREARNIANHLLRDIRAGKHDGCEVWLCTDNLVFSLVLNKGLSSARHLFEIVLDIRVECRIHEVYLHGLHISGHRMVASGMDGWSRGNRDEGISLGYDVRKFIPLHLTAFEITNNPSALDEWLRSWMGSDFSSPLTPEGWFEEGLLPGVHVWAPPPAATLIALRQLALSHQLRPYTTTHVILVPRLLYEEEWRSRFQKEVDLWFVCHTNCFRGTVWPHPCFEPLMVGIRFPFSRSYPWEVKQERERVVELGRALSKMSQTCHIRLGDHLRQLWLQPRSFQGM